MGRDTDYERGWFERARKNGLTPCVYHYGRKVMWELRPKSQCVDSGEHIRLHGVLQKKYVLRQDSDYGGNHDW